MRRIVAAVVGLLLLESCSDDAAEPVRDAGPDAGTTVPKDGAVPMRDATTNLDASNNLDATTGSGDAATNLDRNSVRALGIENELDYGKREMWACLPGNLPNECHADLTATEIKPDGTRAIVPHVIKKDPPFDCFYVYPTVATSGGGNMTDFGEPGVALVRDPLLAQAARFTSMCEVYAPLYRQVSLSTDAGVTSVSGDGTRGYRDVAAAFQHYLANFNKGRKFVLLAHSQGASTLTSLVARVIDDNPTVRGQMISAVLLGSGVTTPEGQPVGGSFKNVPVCKTAGQTGCVVAFVSYAAEAGPGTNGRFGKDVVNDAGVQQVACTEPGALAGNTTGRYRGSYFRLRTNNPSFMSAEPPPADLTTPYYVYRDYFKGECVREGAYGYLKISKNPAVDDKRMPPPYRNAALESTGWGLHLMDYNLPLTDVMDAVRLQAEAALR